MHCCPLRTEVVLLCTALKNNGKKTPAWCITFKCYLLIHESNYYTYKLLHKFIKIFKVTDTESIALIPQHGKKPYRSIMVDEFQWVTPLHLSQDREKGEKVLLCVCWAIPMLSLLDTATYKSQPAKLDRVLCMISCSGTQTKHLLWSSPSSPRVAEEGAILPAFTIGQLKKGGPHRSSKPPS